MKRHKRDPSNRAWNKGYQAGFIGRSRDSCPHQAISQRESWIDGWTIGQRELTEGTLPLAGFHKRLV
jgi:ribosome modulation factor